jgi:hypothetical protein
MTDEAAIVPTCLDHGDAPMKHNFLMMRWECLGWDGEGCPNFVTDEDIEAIWPTE